MTNLNPQLGRINKRSGVKVWPRKWQNLRVTRATELEREFPTHVVTKWCGHTERIAKQHYWMTTEEDFKHAAKWGHSGDSKSSQMDASENPAQEKTPVFPGSAKHDDDLRRLRVEDNGLEPSITSQGNSLGAGILDSFTDAYLMHSEPKWSQLKMLIESCTDLAPKTRQALVDLGDAGLDKFQPAAQSNLRA